jgi:hypothetical protein
MTAPQDHDGGAYENLGVKAGNSPNAPATGPAVGAQAATLNQRSRRGLLRGWRALNTTIFLVGFIAPWLSQCGGQIHGYETPFWLGLGTWALFVRVFRPEMWAEVPSYLLAPIILIGVLGIAVYAAANGIAAISPSRAGNPGRFPITLKAGLIGMLASIIYLVFTRAILDLLWGYWLTWAGLASSFILEVIVRRRGHGDQGVD